MKESLTKYKLLTTADVGTAVAGIKYAFDRKHELERDIAALIRKYEDDTGFVIDMVKYQRDITLPIRGSNYTALNIIITEQDMG